MKHYDRLQIGKGIFIYGVIIGLYALGLYACKETKDKPRDNQRRLEQLTNDFYRREK